MDPGASDPAGQAAWLARDAVDCLPAGGLARKLADAARARRPMRVKLGMDPTAPDVHLGHVVVLRKLREFQDLGHRVVLIVGDYTARVGDPSGRSALRPALSPEEIDDGARTYERQALTVLDRSPERLEVRRNGEWLDMRAAELFALARTTTVAQVLERDDFAGRWAAHAPISILELLYPLLQGYDSVQVDADVELGGTDQRFNLLLARDIQRAYGKPEQAILTMPLLAGLDGERKMSKSLGNYVGVTEPAEEIYGKTMRIPDALIADWRRLLLGEAQAPADAPPRDAKRALAWRLAARFGGGEAAADAAQRAFDRQFIEHRPPDDVPEAVLPAADRRPVHLPALLADLFDLSRSEARRLLAQGGVRLDGEPLGAEDQDLPAARLEGALLQLGKRRFRRLRAPEQG